MIDTMKKKYPTVFLVCVIALCMFIAGCTSDDDNDSVEQDADGNASQSSTVQISENGGLVYSINLVTSTTSTVNELSVLRGEGVTCSLSITRVRDGGDDTTTVLAELLVETDPRSVSINEKGNRAYVSNGGSNSVSVIEEGEDDEFSVIANIGVGSEPRGTALSPSGKTLYVANYSDGTLSVIDTTDLTEKATIDLGIDNPYAVTVTDDGDDSDSDETIYVTNFFAKPLSGLQVDQREGFDDAKEGLIVRVDADELMVEGQISLSPIASGFTADRTEFNVDNNVNVANDTYLADDVANEDVDPQDVHFNQLYSLVVDNDTGLMYVPCIGAQPEPPVRFNVNVQALVGVVDTDEDIELEDRHTNLNDLIKAETQPTPPFTSGNSNRLDRAFAADTVAMAIHDDTALFLSRAGAYVLRGTVDSDGNIALTARDDDGNVRIECANIPTGIVINNRGDRAYVNSDRAGQLTVINLEDNSVVNNIETTTTPSDTQVRRNLLGALAFFTGMGLTTDGTGIDEDTDIKDIDSHRFRNMASDNNWSSCASCHPDGLADSITWIFPTGPRQTVPLDASFAPGSTVEFDNPNTNQRIFNWNGVRSSFTDFNNNARGVQGGFGFTDDALDAIDNGDEPSDVADAANIFNHGPRYDTTDVPEVLDFMTEWAANNIRVFNRPSNIDEANAATGRTIFAENCASCHTGAKWTKSRRIVVDPVSGGSWPDPAFGSDGNPVGGADTIVNPAATAITAFEFDSNNFVFQYQEDVGTLDLTNPIEIRGAGGLIGEQSAGAAVSFNIPSLLNVRNTAPYGHHGRAQTLDEVFDTIASGGLEHSDFGLSTSELNAVIEFIQTIDGNQPPFPEAEAESTK